MDPNRVQNVGKIQFSEFGMNAMIANFFLLFLAAGFALATVAIGLGNPVPVVVALAAATIVLLSVHRSEG